MVVMFISYSLQSYNVHNVFRDIYKYTAVEKRFIFISNTKDITFLLTEGNEDSVRTYLPVSVHIV